MVINAAGKIFIACPVFSVAPWECDYPGFVAGLPDLI